MVTTMATSKVAVSVLSKRFPTVTFPCNYLPVVTSRPHLLRDAKDLVILIRDALPSLSWLDACVLLKECIPAPVVGYLVADATGSAKLARRVRATRRREHAQRQFTWFCAGGRERHYAQKYRFGADHYWFLRGIKNVTGMDVGPGRSSTPTDWKVCIDCEEPEHCMCPPTPSRASAARRSTMRKEASFRRSDESQRYRPGLDLDLSGLVPFVPPTRSIMLLTRLRALIRALRCCTLVQYNTPVEVFKHTEVVSPRAGKTVSCVSAPPQMDGLAGDELATQKTGNVVLVEANPDSFAGAAENRFSFDWHQLCSTEQTVDYSNLTDRFTYVKSFPWKATSATNTQISECAMDLPCDFVNSVTTPGTMPMFVPFKIHKYFKSDIEIKIHVNSNKFQVGQLQFSWQYMEYYDGNPMTNIYSRSQLPHVVVNAGSSNEATMYIPYKYVNPYLETVKRKNAAKALYLGTLRCYVVAPLATGESGPDQCNVTIFMRFPNVHFTGLRDGSVAEPQMEAAATAMVASAVVNKFIGDSNCDNPSSSVNPSYLVPTASHPWSAGKNLTELVHSLRLDHSTKAVGRRGIDNSETSIGVPCRTFGMLKHFTWSTVDVAGNATGSLLWSIDVHPQINKNYVHKITNVTSLDEYALPPISVISGMFRYWRGSLEFRFDVIASMFHTGRLLVSYIPGYCGDASGITLQMARNSACAEFSLQDCTSFTFIVPYIANVPWWPRQYTGPHKYSESICPSKLVIFVLNPLIPMESVVNHVTIVPYVRAGEDFEVSVLVQPANGLSDDTRIFVADKDKIMPTPGSAPYRVTNYEGFGEDKKVILYEGTDTLGTACTFLPPSRVLKENEYYYGKAEHPEVQPSMVYNLWDGTKFVKTTSQVGYITLWSTDKGSYGIPHPATDNGEQRAKEVAKLLRQGAGTNKIFQYIYDYVEDGSTGSADYNKLKFIPQFEKLPKKKLSVSSCGSFVLPEMDDQRYRTDNTLQSTSSLPSTSGGVFNFNESFTDLKDMCRRYQLYFDQTLVIPKGFNDDSSFLVFPCIPSGLDLNVLVPSNVFNICRDGVIPLVANSYLFFRGSLRFRLIFSGFVPQVPISFWIQHHPDGDADRTYVQAAPLIDVEDDTKSHGYAYYIQSVLVNNIVEFEVPFYQCGMYGLLRKRKVPDSDSDVHYYYSLGNISVGAFMGTASQSFDMNVKCFYSIGDDFSFNVFRGFNTTVFCDEVWPPMLRKKDKTPKKRPVQFIAALPEMEEAHIADPEMFTGWFKNLTKSAADVTTAAVTDSVKEVVSVEAQKLSDKFAEISAKFSLDTDNPRFIIQFISQIGHILINPTPATIAWSVGTFIAEMLSEYVLNVVNFIGILKELITDYWSLFVPNASCAVPQMAGRPEDSVHMNTLCGLLFTAVCGFFGKVLAPPGKFPNVLRDINSGVSLANNVLRLVQNCSETIVFCSKYAFKKLYPDHALHAQFYNEVPEIQKWFEECDYLLDVRNKATFLYDKQMMSRVFDATVVGSILISNGINDSNPAGKLVCDTHMRMRKLQTDLFERGVHPDVRFETYPIFITGPPGVGKSYLVKDLVKTMLKSINYTGHGSLIYDIPSGAKYWSGCQNPAVLVSDDLFQVGGTRMEDEIANIFLICSSSVLNPPMAAVEEKERRLNPFIYVQNCNSAFPNLSPTCKHPEAVYRRRKFLLDVALNDVAIESLGGMTFRDAAQIPASIRKDFGHLKIRYALDVKNPETEWSPWFSYRDMCALVCADFSIHYEHERENFKTRMCDMYCLDPSFDERNIITEFPEIGEQASLKEQIAEFKRMINIKIDEYNDPSRDPTVYDWIRKKLDSFKALRETGKTRLAELRGYLPQMMDASTCPVDDDFDPVPIATELTSEDPDVVHERVQRELASVYDTSQVNSFFDCEIKTTVANRLKTLTSLSSIPKEKRITGFIDHYFTTHHIASVTDRVRTYMFEFLDLSADIESDYFSFWNDMIKIGDFDLREMFSFFAMFPETADWLVKALLHPDNWTAKIKPLLAKHQINNEIMYSFDKANCIIRNDHYVCFLRKISLNNARGRMFTEDPDAYGVFVVKALRCIFLSHFVAGPGDYAAWFDRLCKKMYKIKKLEDCVPHIDSLYAKLFSSEIPHAKTYLTRLYAFEFFCALLEYFILGGEPDHVCKVKKDFDYVSSYPKFVSFCAARRQLKYRNCYVTKCTSPGCKFNNDFLYYFLAGCAVSCNQRTTVYRRRIWFLSDFEDYEICEVGKALQSRKRPLREGLLAAFGRYCLHFFTHTLPYALNAVITFILERLPKFAILFTASLALTGLGALLGCGAGGELTRKDDIQFENHYFKIDKPKHPVKAKVNINAKSFSASSAPQASAAVRPVMGARITKNQVMLYAFWVDTVSQERMSRSCRCLMLGGRAMLILRHYWEEYEALMASGKTLEFELYFNQKDNLQHLKFNWDQLKQVAWCSSSTTKLTSNFGICVLPNYVPAFKRITDIFAPKSAHSNAASKCDFYGICTTPSFDLPTTIQKTFVVRETPTSSAVYCSFAYSYIRQCPGLCGCLLVSPTLNSGNGAVIGVHVAGDKVSGRGYAEPIYREMFDEFFENYVYINPPKIETVTNSTSYPKVKLDTNVLDLGCVAPKFAHSESGKSKIVPSVAAGQLYPVRTEVNPLRAGDPRQPIGSDPLRDGCLKHGSGDVRPFDVKLVDQVKEALTDRMQQIITPIRQTVAPLSLQQAICGDVDVPYFESLNWKSSEGFPLSSLRPKTAHDKKWLFDLTETDAGYQLNALEPVLQAELDKRDQAFEDNEAPVTVYVDCLKDYRLTPEKCAQPGKTRIFSIAPVQCSIDIRQHLTDFTASLKNSRIQNGIAIGINPDSLEWTSLVTYLMEAGDKIITLDYSNYGPCLMSQLVKASSDCIVAWHSYNNCTPEHVKRISWLLDSDILNPVHLCSNFLYQTFNGIASGSPLTGELNSLPNLMYIRLVYLEIMSSAMPDWANMYYFDVFVRLVVYGDDLIMSVSDNIVSVFNALTIRDALLAHGIKVTSAQKSAELTPYTTLEEATFLKRSFRQHPTRSGIWLAPIDTNSIEECLNWIHKCEDREEAFLESCRASLDLAYSQGPDYYKIHSDKIKKFLPLINKTLLIKTWFDRDNEIFGENQAPVPTEPLSIDFPWFYKLLNSAS